MIETFKNKELSALWSGDQTRIDHRFHRRILLRLDRLNACLVPEDMNHPGFNFHSLNGFIPTRYSVHVNGPWCITFEFKEGNAYVVDFEQYH